MLPIPHLEELPAVTDTDPQAASKLADLLITTISFELPGLGIRHDPKSGRITHKAVHEYHSELLVEAAKECEAELGVLASGMSFLLRARGDTPLHVDSRGLDMPKEEESSIQMRLRLHTADPTEGADAILVNGRPALYAPAGDNELYRYDQNLLDYREPLGDIESRGYERNRNFTGKIEMMRSWPNGMYDPLYVEPPFYFYDEMPCDSVLFRSASHVGPSSAHSFYARHPGAKRDVWASNFYLNLLRQAQ